MSASRVTGEYSLHPLDRDYAYRQLPEDEEESMYNRRNLELRAADFYAGLRKPQSEWKTIDDLAPQLAEFEHRVRAGDYDGACRVLDPIDSDYLRLWGHYARLVEMREKLLGRLAGPSLRAANPGNLGLAYHHLGQVERAVKLYEEALTIAHDIGDRQEERVLFGRLGWAYRGLGQMERAIGLYKEALAIASEIGDRWNEGIWLSGLGLSYYKLGGFERALQSYEEALVIAREMDHRKWGGGNLGRMGLAYHNLGQVKRAIKLYEEALDVAREIGDRRSEVVWLNNLGRAYHALEQFKRAIKLYREALVIAREIGYRLGESYQLLELGKALLAVRELSEAQQRCTDALALDMPEISYSAALALGIALLHQRNPTAGETFADAAARCRAMLDKTADLYEAHYVLAALVGAAVCDPHWAQEDGRAGLLAPALEEYRRALENCAAPGVVRDALRDLEMIRAAGIEGLEPAFELLEDYVGI